MKTKKQILHRTTQNGHAARDQPTREYGAFEQAFGFSTPSCSGANCRPC
jgi:hypothetical protein